MRPQSPPESKDQERILENGEINGHGILESPISPNSSFTTTSIVQSTIEILKPSFLKRGPRKPLTSTSYLDGLRGFAALLVYWQHNQAWARIGVPQDANYILQNVWGFNHQYYFACLPGIRTFFSGGNFAVAVFYVISGYVLTTKPLTYIHSGQFQKLSDNIASALFRRWLRLFLPAIGITFIYISTWHILGFWTAYPAHKPTYWEEIKFFYRLMMNYGFVFGAGGLAISTWLFQYNFHLWSVPMEFRGSIVVFTMVFAFARCTGGMRIVSTLIVLSYFLYAIDGWAYACFISGMLLADLHQHAHHNTLPFSDLFQKIQPHKITIAHIALCISIYLSGVPTFNDNIEILQDSPGWYFLSLLRSGAISEYKWFYLFWASSIFLFALPHIAWLKTFFENRFCQYLGRISYSLYLCHGPILWVFADRVYAAVGWDRKGDLLNWMSIFPLGKGGVLGLELAFLLPHLVILPVTLWVAEVATGLIDGPSVRFTYWFYGRCTGLGAGMGKV